MAYTLIVCEGENNERTLENPQPAAIDQAIDDLVPAKFHFVIVELDPPTEQCVYMQTLIEREGRFGGLYLVEVRYKFTGFFRHYRMHTRDAAEVKEMFRRFAQGLAPNTADWEDITEKLIAKKL